jgi:hypothetical protein
MTITAFSLATRRSEFAATVDLGASAPDLVEVVRFDLPETTRAAAEVQIVSRGEAFETPDDFGWLAGNALVSKVVAAAGEQLVLAVRAESLRRHVRERRAGTRSSRVDIPFVTTLVLSRGVQASAQRYLRLNLQVEVPPPGADSSAQPIDLSANKPVALLPLGQLELYFPPELALEQSPTIEVELATQGLAASALRLLPTLFWSEAVQIETCEGDRELTARWRVILRQPGQIAGARLPLEVFVTAPGLLTMLDDHAATRAEGGGQQSLVARTSVRITGWHAQATAETRPLWWRSPPPLLTPILGVDVGVATVKLDDIAAQWTVEPGETSAQATEPMQASYALDDVAGSFRLPVTRLTLSGWPIAREPRLAVEMALAVGAARWVFLSTVLELTMEPGRARRGGFLPIVPPSPPAELTALLERGTTHGQLEVLLSGQAEPGKPQSAPRFRLRMPLVAQPEPRRFTICLDFGATGIAAWLGAPAAAGTGDTLQQLPLADAGPVLTAMFSEEPPSDVLLPALAPPRSGRGPPAGPGALLPLPYLTTIQPHEAASPLRPASCRMGATGVAERSGTPQTVAVGIAALIVQRLLAAAPALRQPEFTPSRLVPRIVLTCPLHVPGEAGRWQQVAGLLRRHLEPWFPGISTTNDAVILVSAALAAGRHAASQLEEADPTGGKRRLLSLDIGATATHAAVLDVSETAISPLLAFSVPLGGDALHAALVAWVWEGVQALLRRHPALWQLAQPEEALTLAARDFAPASMSRAHRALSHAVAQAQLAPQPFAAAATAPLLRVEIARSGQGDLTRGLLLPRDPAAFREAPWRDVPAPGVCWLFGRADAAGERVLTLELGQEALAHDTPALAHLAAITQALAITLPRMARAALPAPARREGWSLSVSGRGSLWPPLRSALQQGAAETGDMLVPGSTTDPDLLKLAPSAGAAILAAEGAAGRWQPRYPLPLALAVLRMQVTSGDAAGGAHSTGLVVQRLYYLASSVLTPEREYQAENPLQPSLAERVNLGQRFAVVRALPGLDPAGRVATMLRSLSRGWEPIYRLGGEAFCHASSEGMEAFGPCNIRAQRQTDGSVMLSVSTLDGEWRGRWIITGDQARRTGDGDEAQ